MVAGVILILLGGLFTIGNWSAQLASRRTDRNVSVVPLIGGGLLASGLYLATESKWWALLGFFFDLGSIVCILSMAWLAQELWCTSRFSRLHLFKCHHLGRDITVELFDRGRATIKFKFDQSIAPSHFDECPIEIGFSASWTPKDNGFEVFDYADGGSMKLTQSEAVFVVDESTATPPSCTRLHGLRLHAVRDT